MGQSNSRSTGHTPLVGTSSIDNDNNGGVTHDAACPSNQAVDEPMSADSEDHSARLPREASSLTQLDLASNLTTAIETHHRGSLDGLASQQTISAATSNSASALAAESSTPPLCHTPSPPTQTSIMSSYDATAPPDDLSDSNTCTSRLSEIESSKRPGNQDGSGKQAAPENHAREPARIQRRTLAERLRNVRRRSSQRLSWALHGRNRSSEGPIEDPSPTSGHTAQLTERQEPLAASQSTLSTPSSSSHIVPTSSSMTEVSSDNASAPAAGTRDPWRVMTPPPEEDLMFEERQRARRMVQEALAQLQNELARPGASRVPIAEDQVQQQELGQVRAPTLTTGPQLPGTLDGMGQSSQPGIARQSPGDQNSVIQSDNARQRLMEESEPLVSLPSRILAPLPRRSASRSTSPPATPTHAVESRPHMFEDLFPNPTLPSTPPAISAASSAAHQPAPNVSSRSSRDLMIPRRILVQGIVSSSPPPPASISSSRPMTANPSRASVGDDAPDMALWNELPGIETVQPHTQEPSLSRRRSASLAEGASANAGGDDWENAISAALAQRSRDAAEDPANMLREQANLIGRLLCVAAAATAATLIPGITVNGSSVAGFGESQGGDLLSGTGIPLGPAPPTQRTTESVGSTRPRSDSFGTFRTQRRDSESDMPTPDTTTAAASTNGSPPSSALREILSNALAAAFRSAPSGSTQSSPLSGTSGGPPVVSSPLGESSFSSTSIRPPSNNIHPLTTAPSAFPEPATAVPPPQPRRSLSDPFGHGTALAIPVASLRAGIPYVSGDHHPTGTFERFLADLQAE